MTECHQSDSQTRHTIELKITKKSYMYLSARFSQIWPSCYPTIMYFNTTDELLAYLRQIQPTTET